MTQPTPAQYESYKATQHEGETLRESEARALLSCANRLRRACEPDCSREDYAEAIRLNQQLWTIFQAALVEPDHAMPRDLRMLLLSLCRYIDKVSFRALAESSNPRLLKSMMEINRNIAAGLSANRDNTAKADMPTAIAPQSARETVSIMTTI